MLNIGFLGSAMVFGFRIQNNLKNHVPDRRIEGQTGKCCLLLDSDMSDANVTVSQPLANL